ncbi:Kinase [Hexamita inflata]|uniref:Kinase n=1 Tax=Hexamita inflata TaxID=28002 RepID=A0AA86UI82_9EUKA|nr:Kinase [Hexamita inflata]
MSEITINRNSYKIYEKIGTGMTTGSTISRAREATSLEFVAYKRIQVRNDQTKQSVAHQCKFLKSLVHPNIVRLIDQSMDAAQQNIYLFFELCQDYSLQKLVQTDRRLPLPTVLAFGEDIRDALGFIHSKQALLNDLHAGSILMSSNGILKLIEFESACLFKQQPLDQTRIQASIQKFGYLHRAPETLVIGGFYSTVSDLYAFGQLLYYMCFGFYVFESLQCDSPEEFANRVLSEGENILEQQLPPPNYDGDLPREFLELLWKLLQPIPFKRATWTDLSESTLFKKSELVIKENLQSQYYEYIKEQAKNGQYGQKYIEQKINFEKQNTDKPHFKKGQTQAIPTKNEETVVNKQKSDLSGIVQNTQDYYDQQQEYIQPTKIDINQLTCAQLQQYQKIAFVEVKPKNVGPNVQPQKRCTIDQIQKMNKIDDITLALQQNLDILKSNPIKILEVLADKVQLDPSVALSLLITSAQQELADSLRQKSSSLSTLLNQLQPKCSVANLGARCDLILLSLKLITDNQSLLDFKMNYTQDFQYYIESLAVWVKNSLILTQKKEELSLTLELAQVFSQFCITFGIQFKQQLNIKINSILTVGLNLFLNLFQDSFQALIRQLGLFEPIKDLAVTMSQAFAVLTDIKFSGNLNIDEIILDQIDILTVSYSQEATNWLIRAFANFSILEQFSGINIGAGIAQRLQTPSKKFDALVMQNKHILLRIQKNHDLQSAQATAILVAALMISDQFMDPIMKNPLNVKNHRIYRYIKADLDLVSIIDLLIQVAGDLNDSLLNQICGLMVSSIQHILDVCMYSAKQFSVQGSYINLKYYQKCQGCIELTDMFYKQNFLYKHIFYTVKQIQAFDQILLALSNTIYETKPEEKNTYWSVACADYQQFIDSTVQVTCRIMQTPWARPLRNNLYYQNQQKFKGLWFSAMQLLKCPNFKQLSEDKAEKSQIIVQIVSSIRLQVPLALKSSFEKYKEAGPCGENVFIQPDVFKQSADAFICAIDIPSSGLINGESFTLQNCKEYLDTLQQAIQRLLTSKSMFYCLFGVSDTPFDLLVLGFKLVGDRLPQDSVNDFLQFTLQFINTKSSPFKKSAYDSLESFIKLDPQLMMKLGEMFRNGVNELDVSHRFVRGYLQQFKNGLQQKIQGQQTFLSQKEVRKTISDHCWTIGAVIDDICSQIGQYLANPSLGMQEYCVVNLEVVLNYLQLYLYSEKILEINSVQAIVEGFAQNIGKCTEKIQQLALDVVLQCADYFAKQKWDKFEQIKTSITKYYKDSAQTQRIEQAISGVGCIKFPAEWVE